jgi:hypothetical protein
MAIACLGTVECGCPTCCHERAASITGAFARLDEEARRACAECLVELHRVERQRKDAEERGRRARDVLQAARSVLTTLGGADGFLARLPERESETLGLIDRAIAVLKGQ